MSAWTPTRCRGGTQELAWWHSSVMQIDWSAMHDGIDDLGRHRSLRGLGDNDVGRKRRLT
jgi:hypothetical protein